MFHTNGSSAGGGLVSSSAVLLVILGACAIFLAHRGIKDWMASRHSDLREHLYGPDELYVPALTGQQDPEPSSEADGGAGDPDDGFDYSIFATDPSPTQ